jgi:hypothetical protein
VQTRRRGDKETRRELGREAVKDFSLSPYLLDSLSSSNIGKNPGME